MATTWPCVELRNDLGRHRIQDQVPTELLQVALLVHQDTLESPLQDMANATMPPVKGLCIDTVQPQHAVTEVGLGRFQEEMIVIDHQAVGIASPVLLGHLPREQVDEAGAIAVVVIDGVPGVPARRDMIERPFELQPQLPGHQRPP